MTEETKIPAWALKEACKRANIESNDILHGTPPCYNLPLVRAAHALAEMLAKHEQPPVERATHIAREVLAIWSETSSDGLVHYSENARRARSGERDAFGDFKRARDYLAEELGDD